MQRHPSNRSLASNASVGPAASTTSSAAQPASGGGAAPPLDPGAVLAWGRAIVDSNHRRVPGPTGHHRQSMSARPSGAAAASSNWPSEAVEAEVPLWRDIEMRRQVAGAAPSSAIRGVGTGATGGRRPNALVTGAASSAVSGAADDNVSERPDTPVSQGDGMFAAVAAQRGAPPRHQTPQPQDGAGGSSEAAAAATLAEHHLEKTRLMLEVSKQQRAVAELQDTMKKNENEFQRREAELQQVLASLTTQKVNAEEAAVVSPRPRGMSTTGGNQGRSRASTVVNTTSPQPAPFSSSASGTTPTHPSQVSRGGLVMLSPKEEATLKAAYEAQIARLKIDLEEMERQEAMCGASVSQMVDVMQRANARRLAIKDRTTASYRQLPNIVAVARELHHSVLRTAESLNLPGMPDPRSLPSVVISHLPTEDAITSLKTVDHVVAMCEAMDVTMHGVEGLMLQTYEFTQNVATTISSLRDGLQNQLDARGLTVDDAHQAIHLLKQERESIELERDEAFTMLQELRKRRDDAAAAASKQHAIRETQKQRTAELEREAREISDEIARQSRLCDEETLKEKFASDEHDHLSRERVALEEDIRKIRESIRTVEDDVIRPKQALLSQKQDQERDLRRGIQQATLKNAESQEQLLRLNERLAQLQKDADQAEVDTRQAKRTLEEVNVELRSATKKVAAALAELDQIAAEKTRADTERDNLEQRYLELKAIESASDRRIEQLEADNRLLEQAVLMETNRSTGGKTLIGSVAAMADSMASLALSPPSPAPPAQTNQDGGGGGGALQRLSYDGAAVAAAPHPSSSAAQGGGGGSRSGSSAVVVAVADVPFRANQIAHDSDSAHSSAGRVRRWHGGSQSGAGSTVDDPTGALPTSSRILTTSHGGGPIQPVGQQQRSSNVYYGDGSTGGPGGLSPRVFIVSPERNTPVRVVMQQRQRPVGINGAGDPLNSVVAARPPVVAAPSAPAAGVRQFAVQDPSAARQYTHQELQQQATGRGGGGGGAHSGNTGGGGRPFGAPPSGTTPSAPPPQAWQSATGAAGGVRPRSATHVVAGHHHQYHAPAGGPVAPPPRQFVPPPSHHRPIAAQAEGSAEGGGGVWPPPPQTGNRSRSHSLGSQQQPPAASLERPPQAYLDEPDPTPPGRDDRGPGGPWGYGEEDDEQHHTGAAAAASMPGPGSRGDGWALLAEGDELSLPRVGTITEANPTTASRASSVYSAPSSHPPYPDAHPSPAMGRAPPTSAPSTGNMDMASIQARLQSLLSRRAAAAAQQPGGSR